MEAKDPDERPHKTTQGEVDAFWAKSQAQGQANMAYADAEHRGRPKAAGAQAAEYAAIAAAWVACLSNTPPQSSAIPLVGYPGLAISSGIDWWEWSAFLKFEEKTFKKLIETLSRAKVGCQERQEPSQWITIDGVSLLVHRSGCNRGGDHGEHYEYKLSYCGIEIGLANRQGDQGRLPNLYVRQTGSDCLRLGARIGQDRIRDAIGRLGATILRERLSRVDVCLDVAGMDIRTFEPFIKNRQFVTRAKCVQPFENAVANNWTGVVVGKRPMRLVIYDKLSDLARKQDALYLQAMIDRRWGGILPKHACRVELQIGREWLRKFGLDSPADFEQRIGAVIEKQLSEWFRLTTVPVISADKEQSRIPVDPLWLALKEAFVNWVGLPDGPLVPVDRSKVLPIQAIKQAVGLVRSALLQMNFGLMKFDDLATLFGVLADTAFPSPEAKEKFLQDFWRRTAGCQT